MRELWRDLNGVVFGGGAHWTVGLLGGAVAGLVATWFARGFFLDVMR